MNDSKNDRDLQQQGGLMKTRSLAQTEALLILQRDGVVFAGNNAHRGRVERVYASTLRALERQGLVVIVTSPDGGLMARPKQQEES